LLAVLARLYCSCVSFFFSSRRRHTRSLRDWSSDVCSSDLTDAGAAVHTGPGGRSVRDAGDGLRPDRRPASRVRVHAERRELLHRSEERRVGKSVDLGGRRIIKKKKNRKERRQVQERTNEER